MMVTKNTASGLIFLEHMHVFVREELLPPRARVTSGRIRRRATRVTRKKGKRSKSWAYLRRRWGRMWVA